MPKGNNRKRLSNYLTLTGTIWAQFNQILLPLSYQSLQHNLIIYILLMGILDDEDDVYG